MCGCGYILKRDATTLNHNIWDLEVPKDRETKAGHEREMKKDTCIWGLQIDTPCFRCKQSTDERINDQINKQMVEWMYARGTQKK